MKVVNIHERLLSAPIDDVGALIDRLASKDDVLWPVDRWPAMRFDRPLEVGAVGGHGPIQYTVESHTPGRAVVFRFTAPRGFVGTHRFEMVSVGESETTLRHVIEMQVAGRTLLLWGLLIRPLHDALLEDALDRAESFTGMRRRRRQWSPWVKFVRWVLRRRQSGNRQ